MIIYMEIPSQYSRTQTDKMPSSNTTTGYVCDDCLDEYGWNAINIKKTSLKNLRYVELTKRWDDTLKTFVTGLHLCRSHSIKRKWQTEQYRKNVMDVLGPILRSEEYRQKVKKHGKYLYKKERAIERLEKLIARIKQDWRTETLDFANMKRGDIQVLARQLKISAKPTFIGAYHYKPGFESWLANELGLPLTDVHKKLFDIQLNKLGATKVTKDYQVIINGVVQGVYQRYHGYVINSSADRSITFSSSLELGFILDCILNGIVNIQSTTNKHRFRIEYNYKNRLRAYYPDFCIDNHELIEIKDSREVNTPMNNAKWQALQSFCDMYRYIPKCVTEQDISEQALSLSQMLTAHSLVSPRPGLLI